MRGSLVTMARRYLVCAHHLLFWVALGLLVLAGAPPATAQITAQLVLQSQPGDLVLGGQSRHFDQNSGSFNASAADLTGDGQVDRVSIFFLGSAPGQFWSLVFGTDRIPANLTTGSYNEARRAPFADPGHPGLDVSGEGVGCNTVTGSFTIEEAVFDYSSGFPRVSRFRASFEQHCEGVAAALTGSISFVDESDLTVPRTTATFAGSRGKDDWYTGSVLVTLSATDPKGPEDIAATYYQINGETQTYSSPFTLSADGFYSISYWSVDRAGNQEAQNFAFIKIDSTGPSVSLSARMELLRTQKGYTALTTVSGRVTDALSGVDPAAATFRVVDEYGLDQPTGPVTLQADGSYSFLVTLDAARSNKDKDGRTYTITMNVADLAGAVGTGSTSLIVPRR